MRIRTGVVRFRVGWLALDWTGREWDGSGMETDLGRERGRTVLFPCGWRVGPCEKWVGYPVLCRAKWRW